MLPERNVNVNKTTKDGLKPLVLAVHNIHVNVSTVLFEHNTNINEKLENDAATLFEASREGHAEVCTVLLE